MISDGRRQQEGERKKRERKKRRERGGREGEEDRGGDRRETELLRPKAEDGRTDGEMEVCGRPLKDKSKPSDVREKERTGEGWTEEGERGKTSGTCTECWVDLWWRIRPTGL